MSSLWRTLEELGIEPLSAGQTAPLPKRSTSGNSQPAAPETSKVLSHPAQATSPAPNLPTEVIGVVTDARLGAALAFSVVEELKRSRPEGFFTRDDICKVALAFLQANQRMGRKALADKITNALGLPEHHAKRVEMAFEALERAGKISMQHGANTISLIHP